MQSDISSFLARNYDADPNSVQLKIAGIHTGLDSLGVSQVQARFSDRNRKTHHLRFAVKQFPSQDAREVAAYRLLLEPGNPYSPRLYDVTTSRYGTTNLYLEWIEAWAQWPWADTHMIKTAIHRMAAVHESLSPSWFRAPHRLSHWDYETALLTSARETIDLIEHVSARNNTSALRRSLPCLRRVVNHLPILRPQLANHYAAVVLHGDIHSGNTVARKPGGSLEVVFLDWARTRIGSALEDISSWLQSLGYWEPSARRFHDTLLREYLRMRGLPDKLGDTLRAAYWIAAASNGLSGAIKYHLSEMLSFSPKASGSEAAFCDWMRIIRRVDALTSF